MALRSPPPSRSYPDSATRRAEAELIDLFTRCQDDVPLFAQAFFGLTLTPFQREVVAQRGRVDATVAGRRTGKTTAKAIQVVHDLTTRGYDRVGYVGAPSVDQAEQYLREIEAAAERSPNMQALLAGGPDKAISRSHGFPTAQFVTGGVLHCRSTVQDGRYLRGKGADLVVLTEAGFIADNVFDRAVRALVLDRHGDIHLDSSPNGDNYLKRIFDRATDNAGRYVKQSRDGYYTSSHGTVYDNPLLDRQDIEAIRGEVPEWVFRTEYLAEFLDDSDNVFSWPLLVKLFDQDYPMLNARYDATKKYALGLDLAQVQDYTAIIVLDVTGQPPYRLAHWRHFRGVPYVGVGGVVEQVRELQRAFNNAKIYVDATTEKAVAESLPNAEAVVFTGPERTGMLSNLIVAAENLNLALPSSFSVLRDEMRAFRRTRTPGGTVRADHPRDGHDDCLWALALACRAIKPGQSRSREAVSKFRSASFWTT